MNDRDRHNLLHGPYRSPRCRLGKKLFCEIRGWVPVRRISTGRIPWPQTLVHSNRAFILTGDLVEAVRRESETAICYWWGITPQTVTVWRKALDVVRASAGSSRLWQLNVAEVMTPDVRRRAVAAMNTPEANAKKSAARRGTPPSPKSVAALVARNKLPRTPEHRRRIGEAMRRISHRPPDGARLWTAEEYVLLGTMPDAEVARKIGRTVKAVRARRRVLRVPSTSGKGPQMRDPRPRPAAARG
jgi:hypothetical protein